MATRRARVKLAPNLGLARNRGKPVPLKPKILVKSDTDISDTEATSDVDCLPSKTSILSQVIDSSETLIPVPTSPTLVKSVHNDEQPVKSIKPILTQEITNGFILTNGTTHDKTITNGKATESDWEDEQFAYQSVEVDKAEMYKSLEITPLTVDVNPISKETSVSLDSCAVNQHPLVSTDHHVNSGMNSHLDRSRNSNTNAEVNVNNNPGNKDVPDAVDKNSNGVNDTGTKERVDNARPRIHIKTKFKPNLNFDRRSRNLSGGSTSSRSIANGSPVAKTFGSPLSRTRTISGSSTNSEPETSKSMSKLSTMVRASTSGLKSPKTGRMRKSTERPLGERSQFMRRKLDHKRKFMKGVPERGSLTMFDLIYYNPEYGQRMSVEDKEAENVDDPENDNQQVPNTTVEIPVAEPATPERSLIAEDEAIAVPQVKVGLNGEIILDESSLQLETTEQKKAKDFLQQSPVVFESNKTTTNYGTWSKKRRHNDWSEKETLRFYRALSVVGSDFSMMESIFKNRTRQELKLKFKKEEKLNNKMIDKCLKERGMYTDLEELMKESDDEEAADDVKGRGRKTTKKRPRRRYKNKGYYDSSSGGEDADEETSRSPARKKGRQCSNEEKQMVRIKRPQVMHRENVNNQLIRPHSSRSEAISLSQFTDQANEGGEACVQVSNSQVKLTKGPGSNVQFPPGLLAANPGLVGAKPGSLVVVASPNKSDPSSQLLHVYMVSSKNKEKEKVLSRSAYNTSRRSVSPRLTLDPAVMRAVDRGRLAERSRTRSESGSKSMSHLITELDIENLSCAELQPPRTRQRTYSESGLAVREGSLDLRTETMRKRFLSGSSRISDLPMPTSSQSLPVARKSKPVLVVETDSS